MKKTLMIRHYVVAEMYRAGNSSVQIMSARDLARHFEIAQSTVSLALKELTDEGYLIARPGIGNFTNPLRMPVYQNREMPPLVGLMCGDGRFFFMDERFWKTYRAVADAVFAHGWNLRQIELSGPVCRESAAEVLDNRVDALIWIGAYKQTEFADELRRAGIPLVVDSPFLPDVNTVSGDSTRQLAALLDYAVAHARHHILFWAPEEITALEIPALLRMAQERSFPLEIQPLAPDNVMHRDFLEAYFRNHRDVLLVADHFRITSGEISSYAHETGSHLDCYLYGSGLLDGQAAHFVKGVAFARAVTTRLAELFAGDSTIRHLAAERDLIPAPSHENQPHLKEI